MNNITILATSILAISITLGGCLPEEGSSDRKMNQQQEKLASEAASQVGMPAIMRFEEKRTLKMILELRDQAISTTTYIVDLNGKLHKICDSVGYGIPYATQYTSPQKIGSWGTNVGYAIVPQADPNGLFSPASAEGTWVMCLSPDDKKVKVVYIEPKVITSPFPLNVN
jgi:hypothetical protein